METKTTCQICARAIKAGKGVIAHHGYQRPEADWQTESCDGARHEPYEVSCDAIPPVIEKIKQFIVNEEEGLKYFMANPPEKLTYKKYTGFGMKRDADVYRPEGFDPNKDTLEGSLFDTYESEFKKRRRRFEQSIKHAKADLAFMEDRLAKWIPPKKEG